MSKPARNFENVKLRKFTDRAEAIHSVKGIVILYCITCVFFCYPHVIHMLYASV